MMVWMNRKLIDVLISLMEDTALKNRLNGLIFIRTPATNPTQHNLRGQDDTQSTIDYHQLDLLRDDGMECLLLRSRRLHM
jgi:hypothetical protein